jgi:hypothetical protein
LREKLVDVGRHLRLIAVEFLCERGE